MLALGYLILGLYLLALTIVLVYCLMQFHLLYHYRKNLTKTTTLPHVAESELPFVTIQLPIYNEYYVVERLIDNIMLLDYPKSKLEVHVLDDSTDETRQLIAGKVAEYEAKGFDILHIHRVDRQGYKAGALKDAMPQAKGEFVAIFDADFLPNADFLKNTMPYFADEKVGVVAKWRVPTPI